MAINNKYSMLHINNKSMVMKRRGKKKLIKHIKKKQKDIFNTPLFTKIGKIIILRLRFCIDIINADIYQIPYLQENHVKYQASYPATKLTNAYLFSNKHLLPQEISPSPRIPLRKPITQAQ